MKRAATVLAAAGAALAVAASAAASFGPSDNYNYGSSASRSMATPARAPRIKTASSSLGRIVVDGRGRTVYIFEKDKGKASTCYGECANVWPPVTTAGAPKAGKGAVAAMLGTIMRRGGKRQVTYNGHPLYTYSGDSHPGQTKGEGLDGFGGEWYVISPAGRKIEKGGS